MDIVIVLLVIAAIAFVVLRTQTGSSDSGDRSGRRRRGVSEEELAGVKRAVDEDVTVFGEELQRLDADMAGRELDEGMRADYQRALDSYEDAKRSGDAVTDPEDVRHVTEILDDGRYAMACVRARVAGEPLPTRRAPCFFNPQHGQSVRDVSWTPAGGTTRDVPACQLDAERVEAGADPHTRQVMVGAQRVPYYQAGPAFAPFTAGYFALSGLLPMMFMGTMMGGMFASDGSYAEGYDEGHADGSEGGDSGDGGDGGDSGSYDAGGDHGSYGGDYGGDYGGAGDFGGDFSGF
ncbi:MAG: hypothetical protein H0V13_06370 [Nocardioidaceae bacterium]|nr:hypothetical protein [Nocardioidaceae bacterium]